MDELLSCVETGILGEPRSAAAVSGPFGDPAYSLSPTHDKRPSHSHSSVVFAAHHHHHQLYLSFYLFRPVADGELMTLSPNKPQTNRQSVQHSSRLSISSKYIYIRIRVDVFLVLLLHSTDSNQR